MEATDAGEASFMAAGEAPWHPPLCRTQRDVVVSLAAGREQAPIGSLNLSQQIASQKRLKPT